MTKLDCLVEGAVIGALAAAEPELRTCDELIASAAAQYHVPAEQVRKAIDRLLDFGEISATTPGPRGPKTRYRLV